MSLNSVSRLFIPHTPILVVGHAVRLVTTVAEPRNSLIPGSIIDRICQQHWTHPSGRLWKHQSEMPKRWYRWQSQLDNSRAERKLSSFKDPRPRLSKKSSSLVRPHECMALVEQPANGARPITTIEPLLAGSHQLCSVPDGLPTLNFWLGIRFTELLALQYPIDRDIRPVRRQLPSKCEGNCY